MKALSHTTLRSFPPFQTLWCAWDYCELLWAHVLPSFWGFVLGGVWCGLGYDGLATHGEGRLVSHDSVVLGDHELVTTVWERRG